MKPMFGLHKDNAGSILAANSFNDEYDLGGWIKKLDLRDGDRIEFGEVSARAEFAEVDPAPSRFIEPPPSPEPAAEDDLTF